MASHRMPDRDRPRRAVPAWVVAPPDDAATGREARPAPAAPAPAVAAPAPAPAAPAAAVDVVASPSALGASVVGSPGVGSPGVGSPVVASPVVASPVVGSPVGTAPVVDGAVTATPAGATPAAGPTDAARLGAAPVTDPTAGPAGHAPVTGAPTGALPDGDVVVPDYPPQEHLLPPAPTSPAVQVPPFDTAPLPVSPVDGTTERADDAGRRGHARGPLTPPSDPAHRAAGHPAPVQPAAPAAPVVGQPRFSVPGLEHVLVEGAEPEPSGPIGYRTPARFARQQAPRPVVVEPAPTPFDAVIAPPVASGAPVTTSVFPAVPDAAAVPAVDRAAGADAPGSAADTSDPAAGAGVPAGSEPGLQAGRGARRDRSRTTIGATPAAVLGAVTGVAALALGAWWFTAPATVHATGLVLGVLALLLSATALRAPAATWQRPVALLGAVLGGVGTLVLLWAVASALLPLAGVTLPDLTGTGTTPTIAP